VRAEAGETTSLVDRVADPWGERTPYGRGQPWPVRVDAHLAEGVAAEDVERWVPTASVLHSNGDGLKIAVRYGALVGVRGRAGDRVNHGRVDPKDLFGRSSARPPRAPATTPSPTWSAPAKARRAPNSPGSAPA